MWKFKSLKGRDRWIFLLTIGAVLCILAFPAERFTQRSTASGRTTGTAASGTRSTNQSTNQSTATRGKSTFLSAGIPGISDTSGSTGSSDTSGTADISVSSRAACETTLEARVRSVLEHVEGIGTVDVMIVQEPADETATRTTGASLFGSISGDISGDISGGSGGSRAELEETVTGIRGIIISADGGGSPAIQAEISEAMEALFGLPPHKIKVMKRAGNAS
jgi:stage III sporulation protein AG